MPDADVLDVVAGVRESHARLAASIAELTEVEARQPSLLPGWSVGHVLTHLARNADSHTRMLRAALAGDVVHQYDGGMDARAAGIEAGAARPVASLVQDIAASSTALEAAYSAMTDEAWAGHGLNQTEEVWPCELMPFHRWREVELHRVDLGLGYLATDWPAGYVARELAVSLAVLPERLTPTDSQRVLGWLTGRSDQPSDVALEPWQARRDHYLALGLCRSRHSGR